MEHFKVDREIAEQDLLCFYETLEKENMIRSCKDKPTHNNQNIAQTNNPAIIQTDKKYSTPSLNRYDDMQDLLLVDPIHGTDEAGWPFTKN